MLRKFQSLLFPEKTSLSLEFAGRPFLFSGEGSDQIAEQMRDGSFEIPLPLMVMAFLSRMGGLFIDVGANSGIYSVLAGVTRPDIHVLAFEPFPAAYMAFKRNVKINGLTDRVTLAPIALSDVAEHQLLYIPPPQGDLLETSCSLEVSFKGGDDASSLTTLSVETKPLDQLDINEQITVIKVDIEGHEHAFLLGAAETITRHRPVIFIELLPGARFSLFQEFFKARDYLHFRMRPNLIIFDDAVCFDMNSWNHAFIPREQLSKLADICTTHAFEIVQTIKI